MSHRGGKKEDVLGVVAIEAIHLRTQLARVNRGFAHY